MATRIVTGRPPAGVMTVRPSIGGPFGPRQARPVTTFVCPSTVCVSLKVMQTWFAAASVGPVPAGGCSTATGVIAPVLFEFLLVQATVW